MWTLAVLAVIFVSYRRFFAQPGGVLTDADAMDFSQIARNMANGHGFATSVLRPLAVTGFGGPDQSGVAPDISHAPLYPFVLMLFALAHGGRLGDNTVVLVSLLLFLASVVAVYRLARLLFPAPEQAGIALLAVGLYAIGGEALGYALYGLPVTLATLLVTLLMIALHRAHEVPGRAAGAGSALLVGVLLGLCYLTQFSLLVLTVPALVYLFFSRAPQRAWAGVGACALGFFVITGPWLIRSAALSHGNPFFTLYYYSIMDNSDAYPGPTTIYRSAMPQVSPLVYFSTHIPDMLARLGRGLTYYRDQLLQAFDIFLLAAAVTSLVWRAPDARLNALRGYAAVCLLGLILVTSLFVPSVRIIAPFAPLITVVAVGFVFSILAEQGWDPLLQRTAIWSLGLLVGLGALVQFLGRTPTPPNPVSGGIQLVSNQGLTAPNIVISDTPWELSWRTGVSTLWLPADNTSYEAVASTPAMSKDGNGRPIRNRIQGMLLTPAIIDYSLDEAGAWIALSKNPNAVADHARKKAQLDQYVAGLVQRQDPRVRGLTPAAVQQLKEINLAKFDPDFGASDTISDMRGSFLPIPSVTEANHFNSTLFLRTAGTSSGQ